MGSWWFLGALVLYTATGAWDLVWGDASKLTLYAAKAYFPSLNPGDHAGWTLLAWLAVKVLGGDSVVLAHRFSGLAGALAVGCLAAYSLRRGAPPEVAHTRAAVLLVAHSAWWAAGAAESYMPALAAVLVGACLAAGRWRWRWLPAGLAWGAALAIHAWSVFLVVPLAREVGRRGAVRLLPGVVIGLAPVWLALWITPTDPLTGFDASGGGTWEWHVSAFLDLARAPRNAVLLAALLLYGLGPLGVAAVLRGWRDRESGWLWWVSLGVLAGALLGYVPYRLHLMVVFLLVGVLLAVPSRLSAVARRGHAVLQAVVYLVVPWLVAAVGYGHLGARVLPARDNASYFLGPVRAGGGAADYIAAVGRCAPQGAEVLADFNTGSVLRLAQEVRGWRTDLKVQPVAVDVALGRSDPAAALASVIREARRRGSVLLADTYEPYYRLGELGDAFPLVPCGPVVLVGSGHER